MAPINFRTLKHTFTKAERLKSKRLIDALFSGGKAIARYPVRLIWIETPLPADVPCQFALSVPSRRFPRASDRNLMRRRMREALRLNKSIVTEAAGMKGKQYALFLLFIGRNMAPYHEVEQQTVRALERLASEI